MLNLGAVLKSEIMRLARRSSRAVYLPIKKDVAALKHAIAEHKRLLARIRRDSAWLMSHASKGLTAPLSLPGGDTKGARMGPRLIFSQRKRLGLSRKAFAALLGVSSGTIVAWEVGRSKPRETTKNALVAVRKLGKREAYRRLAMLGKGKGFKGRFRKQKA